MTGRNPLAKCMRINSDTRKISTNCQRALKKSLDLFIEILNSKEMLAIFSVNIAGETALILSKILFLYALCVPSTQLFGVKCWDRKSSWNIKILWIFINRFDGYLLHWGLNIHNCFLMNKLKFFQLCPKENI